MSLSSSKSKRFSPQTRKRKEPRIERSLSIILKSLQGQKLSLELKNDHEVTGILDEVDDEMNMALSSALVTTLESSNIHTEVLNIKGTEVRYVHLHRSLDVDRQTQEYMRKVDKLRLRSSGNKKNRSMKEAGSKS